MWTRPSLEQTSWAREFRKDSPVSYATAITFALQDRLEVFVERGEELGEPRWEIKVLDSPEFLMDFRPTKKSAESLCKTMNWKVAR